MEEKRFNLATRVNDDGNTIIEVHDREKRPLFGAPFKDDELGGGILTMTGSDREPDAQGVCDALNTLNDVPHEHLSPAVIRAASHILEVKRDQTHADREYLDPWLGHTYKVPDPN